MAEKTDMRSECARLAAELEAAGIPARAIARQFISVAHSVVVAAGVDAAEDFEVAAADLRQRFRRPN